MRAGVVIPWRGGDRSREAAEQYVEAYLVGVGFGGGIAVADSPGPGPFSRAAAKNAGVESMSHCDVVIIHDADMVAPRDAYEEMATVAHDEGVLVVGFTQYRALSQQASRRVIRGADPFTTRPYGVLDGWSLGGIIAIRTDAFATVGGFDTRFQGWGCEDWAFAHTCSILLGATMRTDNIAVHLWHPHGTAITPHEVLEANARLLERYTTATTPEAVREVQAR